MAFLKHKVYGIIFKLFRFTKVNNNRVTFIIDSKKSFKGNLDYIKREFERRGNFEFNFFYKDKISFSAFKKLASSRYIFLNDNFFAMAFMSFKKENMIIQLWHAPGASKKFGGSVEVENRDILKRISNNTDYLITTSDNIASYYSEAFQMPPDKIKALGLPRLDYYFENHDIDKMKKDFKDKYEIPYDKKVILYAPTFREDTKYNDIFNYFDLNEFNNSLGDEYIIALRLHPKIRKFYSTDITSSERYIDVSDYISEQELMLISDMLITDYSSIMIEYGILNRPIIFFTYDLDNYLASERGFYYDFKSTVPGPIVYTTSQLISTIRNHDFDKNLLSEFLMTQFGEIDGQSSKRIVDFVLNNEV